MLRPSRRGPTRSEFDGEEKKGIINTIKKLDLHPKAEASTQKKSASGAFVSIFLIVVVLFVFWEESSVYWKPITEDFMFIDTERTEKMKIFLDISFYKMTCDEVSVDAMDNNGEQQIAVEHEIYKTSMREDGEALEHRRQTQLGQAEAKVFLPPDYCGSCFGAAPAGSCCNSCAELRATFRQYGRDVSFADAAPQCLREKKYGPLPGEHGCRVRGTLTVAKMKGNFHVAAGMSHAQGHMDHSHHIHHINLTTINSYDISHHINKLSFGEEYPGMKNPLDGADFIAPGLGNLGYYIQLVPTAYESTTGETVMTNQYSVYEHYTAVDTTQQHYKLPGVFFKYEFWPMRIKYAEQTKPFLPFLIRVCAIIGGLYVIAGICYSLVSSVLSLPKRGSGGGSRRGQIFQDMF